MLRARLFWRWCRVHPKASGIGALVLALFVLAGALRGSDHNPDTAAADSPSGASFSQVVQPSTPPVTSTRSASRTPSPGTISVVPADLTRPGQTSALALLATLAIKGRAPKTGYSRDQFGAAWTDDNSGPLGHNGCDTRNDVLRRDLTDIALKPDTNGCAVLTGVLLDPYTATTIQFTRGTSTSSAVQIDHVVALSNAWQTGAGRWTAQTRTGLANDPLNLLAVDGSANAAKGDGDAATWLPPNKAYRCAYVARQVAVKARYQLWTTQAEHDAAERILDTCPDQPAPTESGTPTVELAPGTTTPGLPRTSPAPAVTPSKDIEYSSCDAVRAAGAAPLYRGQPGYAPHLDGDGDGVACE